MEILTVIAIFMGPISALLVAGYLNAQRERRIRKMDVFRMLMRTRRTPMNTEHVGALNLIEIEFDGVKPVIDRWRELFNHFGAQHQKKENEADRAFQMRLATERQKILAKLLHAIAKNLKFGVEQLEIFDGGYTPQGWEEIEMQQHAARNYIVDLYLGRRAVPVAVMDYATGTIADENDNSAPLTNS